MIELFTIIATLGSFSIGWWFGTKYLKNLKLTARDKYLLTVFIVCCVLVAVMTGELIVHAK